MYAIKTILGEIKLRNFPYYVLEDYVRKNPLSKIIKIKKDFDKFQKVV